MFALLCLVTGDYLRGKNVLEIPGTGKVLVNHVKLSGSEDGRLVALNLMTGERLWDVFYRGNAAHTRWPIPDLGEELTLGREGDGAVLNSDDSRTATLLSGQPLGGTRGYFADADGVADAYETREQAAGATRIWWIDRSKNALVLFGVAGEHHEVDRPLERVFSTEEKKIWGSEIRRE